MSTNVDILTNKEATKQRHPLVGYALIAGVAITLLVIGIKRALSHGETLTAQGILNAAFYTILTGGACMIAELSLYRMRPAGKIIKERRVLRRERRRFQADYQKAMKAINKIIGLQEAWAGTKTILEGVYDRVYRTRCVYYFRKTKTQPFCACSHQCPNTCTCPICHEGGRG